MNEKKMTAKEVECRVKRAFDAASPDILETVLEKADQETDSQGKVIFMTEKKTTGNTFRKFGTLAACAAVVLTAALGTSIYRTNYMTTSTVSLDVNPSIMIEANSKEKVLEVTARNKDAQKVLGEMDFEGASLDVTVNAIIGSMLREGYLNDLANSVLISVDTKNPEKGEKLREKLTAEISITLEKDNFEGAIIGQSFASGKELKTTAEEYDITPGKANLIQKVLEEQPTYSFEELAALSVNELNLLFSGRKDTDDKSNESEKLEKDKQTDKTKVEQIGSASEKAYIGAAKAEKIALGELDSKNIVIIQNELDLEDGIMVYEIECRDEAYEYEFDIHAMTGEILKHEQEALDQEDIPVIAPEKPEKPDNETDEKPTKPEKEEPKPVKISKDDAKALVLEHADVKESAIFDFEIEGEKEDGTRLYEISFKADGFEYDYEIDAYTGEILKSEKEADDDFVKPETPETPTKPENPTKPEKEEPKPETKPEKPEKPTLIGEEKAWKLVWEHAGVKSKDSYELEIETDTDDGVTHYEISFKAGGFEYDYEINAITGAILKVEKEADDDFVKPEKEEKPTKPEKEEPKPVKISKDDAKALVLEHADVKESAIFDFEIEGEKEDGTRLYEISFKADGFEYDYEIDAYTGEILKSEKEADDDFVKPEKEEKPTKPEKPEKSEKPEKDKYDDDDFEDEEDDDRDVDDDDDDDDDDHDDDDRDDD